MNIFMQLVLGLGIFLMVGSFYLVFFIADTNFQEKIIFCLFAAGMIYFGCYKGVRRVIADDKKREEKKKNKTQSRRRG